MFIHISFLLYWLGVGLLKLGCGRFHNTAGIVGCEEG